MALTLLLMLVLTASAQEPADWTFMVYLDGDNNLEYVGIVDFLEMATVGSDANVNIVVQFDRIDGYDDSYGDWITTKRYLVTSGTTPTAANALSDIGEANMGDPSTLVDFVNWARSNYPADNYALVLWNHGSGWKKEKEKPPNPLKAICYDDTSGGDPLTMAELRSALGTITSGGSDPIHLLASDACLMGMIEVDYQIQPYAEVRTSSEEVEPGDGYPYDTILGALTSNPTWTAIQLGDDIVDKYYASYGNDWTHSAVTLSGSGYTDLVGDVDAFARVLINYMDTYSNIYTAVRDDTQEFDDPTFVDLYDFAEGINMAVSEPAINNAATAVMNSVTNVVINEQHGSRWPGANGVSIHFPHSRPENGYANLAFGQDTQWDEFLDRVSESHLDCSLAMAAECGGSYDGDTTGSPLSNVDYYGCVEWEESGPEDVYVLTTTSSGDIVATLSNMAVDLNVFILSGCNEYACEAFGDSEATYYDAPPGTYYIVVDGHWGAAGSYRLDITCVGGGANGFEVTNALPFWCGQTGTSQILVSIANDPAEPQLVHGLEVYLRFDPTLLQVVDADGDPTNGVQIAPEPGLFPLDEQIVVQVVDNEEGTILFAVSRKGGDSVQEANDDPIATITWEAAVDCATMTEEECSEVSVEDALMSDADGYAITATTTLPGQVCIQGAGCIMGSVNLQGSYDHSGVTIIVTDAEDNIKETVTDADGNFVVCGLTPGSYEVQAEMYGYLDSRASGVVVVAGETTNIDGTKLLGGDVAPQPEPDNAIGIGDITYIASRFLKDDMTADVNGDDVVNIQDLTIATANFGRTGPTPWSMAP